MNAAFKISEALSDVACKEQAEVLSYFFKTGPGEYGEGDRFLGVKVPKTREIVKRFKNLALSPTYTSSPAPHSTRSALLVFFF